MVKCFYDLHIHSNLSPCADELMTVNNIVNMSNLKGLDIIAVTDHNSAKNIEAVLEFSQGKILVIPGIEVETYEGIHMLCYFKTLKDIKDFDKIIYQNLPDIKNNEKMFGRQVIYNKDDEEISYEKKMLINSTKIKLNDLVSIVHLLNGIIIASHVDRMANSILNVLGFIPDNLLLDGIEISMNVSIDEYLNNSIYNKYRICQNSDAHYIENICEKNNYFSLKDKTIDSFFEYFGDKK